MSAIYVMKATYERNSNDGIHHFQDTSKLADAVLEAYAFGATNVKVFRCVEVQFNAYHVGSAIDIGKDV